MKVRVLVPQTGLYNGEPWPEKGSTIDLPDHVAEGMIHAKQVAKVDEKVEKRPASTQKVEKRESAPSGRSKK